jgi:hypothetical protein
MLAITRFWLEVRRNSALPPSACSSRAISRRPVRCRTASAATVQRTIDDAPRRDAQGDVLQVVAGIDPAEAVAVVVETERARRPQGKAGAPFHFVLEPVQAAVVDGVLEARALAHRAVADGRAAR